MNIDFRVGTWLNEPRHWNSEADSLTMTTGDKTDFWRETYYEFTRDNGHFLGVTTGNSFTATIRVRGELRTLYDQAGLMVRCDKATWIKTGVEFTDGELFLSTVVTVGKSDWSISQPFTGLEDFYIRVTVNNGSMRVQASSDGIVWPLLRLAPFPVASSYLVGPTACSPERSGLTVLFTEFQIDPALSTGLHDLS